MKPIFIQGILSELPEDKQAIWRSRFLRIATEYLTQTKVKDLQIVLSTIPAKPVVSNSVTPIDQLKKNLDEVNKEDRATQYQSVDPLYTFDFLIIPKEVKQNLLLSVNLIHLETKVFDEWNLRKIEPFPRTVLNFYGAPGTGKTLAAHAVAHYLEKPILITGYAQVESKYHGEGPKNVEALFYAAERDNAVLFIDEADSLLSKRLTNVTQGSEQAINSMRSQLLICLERFKGVVIFATNLVNNYDKAFETRVQNIFFPLPDEENRKRIWETHLKFENGPPLANNVSITKLAQIDDVCGRDIKNAVIYAALQVAQEKRQAIEVTDLQKALQQIKASRIQRNDVSELQPANEEISKRIQKALQSQEHTQENKE